MSLSHRSVLLLFGQLFLLAHLLQVLFKRIERELFNAPARLSIDILRSRHRLRRRGTYFSRHRVLSDVLFEDVVSQLLVYASVVLLRRLEGAFVDQGRLLYVLLKHRPQFLHRLRHLRAVGGSVRWLISLHSKLVV